jgi:hypothetical protein
MEPSERRRGTRLPQALPVQIHGYNSEGDVWAEVSAAFDVSSGGVAFLLERPVQVGQVLRVDLPLPRTLRSFDATAPTYRVFVLVRNVLLSQEGYRIGTMFFGKEPPRGFEGNPAGRFLLPWDRPEEPPPLTWASSSPPPPPRHEDEPKLPVDPDGRRQSERFEVLVNLLVQQADEWGEILKEELTVTDNLGNGGAQLRTTLALTPGDVVFVREMDGSFETRAEVCGASVGNDGIRRLHLKFIGGKTPAHLIPKS